MAPTVAAALLVVVGCTYSEREPGLLDRDTPQPTVGPPSSKSPPTPTPPGREPETRWPARRSGHRPMVWTSRSGSLCTPSVGSTGGPCWTGR